MRLPFSDREVDLGRLFATPSGDLHETSPGALGADGDSWYSGVYAGSSESNPLFRGRGRYIAFNEMRADSWVRAILWLYKLPIRNATHEVVPSGQGKDEVDKAVARAVEWQFGLGEQEGKMSQSYDEWMTQRLLCLDWGSVFEEIIWASELDWWPEREGEAGLRLMRPIARMGLRRPSTISKLKWNDETAAIERVWQDLPGVSEAGIPGDKIAHYAIERDGETDWMGTSLIRAAWTPFRLKKGLTTSSAIAWDRWASKLPVIYHPKGRENKTRAEKLGQNVRTHERAYATFEGAKPVPGQEGWQMELLGDAPSDPVGLLRHYDQQMSAGALTMFANLGTTETGSRAVGSTLIEPYYLAILAVAKQIALDSRRDVVRRFVDVNFGHDVDAPAIAVRKISQRTVEGVVNALSLMAGIGFNVIDEGLRDTLLEQLDLDALPEDFPLRAEGTAAFPGAERIRQRIAGTTSSE